MDKQERRYLYVIGVVTITMMVLVLKVMDVQTKIGDIKLDKCQFAMQKAIPDPNDDSRIAFLKNCYND